MYMGMGFVRNTRRINFFIKVLSFDILGCQSIRYNSENVKWKTECELWSLIIFSR